MNHSIPAYDPWSLLIIDSAIFILFAFSVFKPRSKRERRFFGAFWGFIVALLVGSEFFRPIHLLITRIEMRVYRNGLEPASCFRVMHPETKVLLINGCEAAAKRNRCPAINGEWAIISKLFTKCRLLESVSRAIGSEVPA